MALIPVFHCKDDVSQVHLCNKYFILTLVGKMNAVLDESGLSRVTDTYRS